VTALSCIASLLRNLFRNLLLGVFAALALALAAIGVYGVIAYAATQRTHEIGIRMAMGARGADVMRMLIGQGMVVVAIGVAIGLGGAWMLTRVMKTLLFHVGATDPLTFVGVAIVLAGVAWVPVTFQRARHRASIQ
jgi:putative ABC transport system permease protein